MIKRTHIDHAELLELGKMMLLLTERQQNTMDFSALTEGNKKVSAVKDLPRAS
jgi:hypothetical protein